MEGIRFLSDMFAESMSHSVESAAEYGHGEEGYDYEYYPDDYFDSDMDYETMSGSMDLLHISKSCVIPTLTQVSVLYLQMFFMCFCFQVVNKFPFVSSTVKHILSFLFGFAALWLNFQSLISHSVIVSLVSYILAYTFKFSTSTITVTLLTYLTTCEFVLENAEWARIRSIQMILTMKIISLLSDSENERIHKAPTFIQYLGYLFSVFNCIYGPWINFSTYEDLLQPGKWRADYFARLAMCIVTSLLCFILSTCYLDWLLPDDLGWSLSFMYKQAIIFRTSHYFVMFMSEAFIISAGKNVGTLVSPSRIEFPRSLVEVVIYWNVPMHKWLKMYVFYPLRRYGLFIAITGTYFVSSLLHGLNYQLSGILLSLAIYTYVEHVLRKQMARRLSACILSKSCPSECYEHFYTQRFAFVKLINLVFSLVDIYHLSYLGCLIDLHNDRTLSFKESFKRWHDQSYSSHVLALGMAVIYLLLQNLRT